MSVLSLVRNLILAASAVAAPVLANAATVNVNFDELPANCCYSGALVTGAVAYPSVTIDGGSTAAVMNNEGWANMQTSGANLYGTLGGSMALTFNQSTSNFAFDLINGTGTFDFTVSLFDQHGALVDSSVESLNSWSSTGSVGHFSFADTGVYSVLISGNGDFAIDTLSFETSASTVPEPASSALMMFGVLALAVAARRRRNAA